MCHSPAFTMWLYLAEDQPPGALRALACGVAVDPEDEPEPETETPAERTARLRIELGYDPLTEKGWKPK